MLERLGRGGPSLSDNRKIEKKSELFWWKLHIEIAYKSTFLCDFPTGFSYPDCVDFLF